VKDIPVWLPWVAVVVAIAILIWIGSDE